MLESAAYFLVEEAASTYVSDNTMWAVEELYRRASDFQDEVTRWYNNPFETRRDFHELEDAFHQAHMAISQDYNADAMLMEEFSAVARHMHKLRWAYGYGYRGSFSYDHFRVGLDFHYYP
jgi:hypothetical protein